MGHDCGVWVLLATFGCYAILGAPRTQTSSFDEGGLYLKWGRRAVQGVRLPPAGFLGNSSQFLVSGQETGSGEVRDGGGVGGAAS